MPISDNYKSGLFFWVSLMWRYDWPTTLLFPFTQHSDLTFLHTSNWSPRYKSGYIRSPYKDTAQSPTEFSTLCVSHWWLIYLAAGSLFLLLSLICFSLPPSLFVSDSNLLALYTMALSVLLGLFVCFLQIPHVGEIMYLSNLFHLALYSLDPCCHKWQDIILFMAEKYSTCVCVCVCVTLSLSIHLFEHLFPYLK